MTLDPVGAAWFVLDTSLNHPLVREQCGTVSADRVLVWLGPILHAKK